MADFRRFWFRLRRFVSRSAAVRRREKSGSFDHESTGRIARLIPGLPLALDEPRLEAVRGVAECYRNNLFDVLGSGWIEASPGVSCRGFRGHRYANTGSADSPNRPVSDLINESNRAYSQEVRKLIDGEHKPIDWQRDYKSGFQWDSKAPSNDGQIGEVAGSDIKVPWELSKLQHLPQLAIAFATRPSRAEGVRYVSTFQNQLLDFIASNPPGYGAAWYTAMLAGIRAANILVSFDIFRAYGASFTDEFENVVLRTAIDHARFIVGNLDWWVDDQRNNHFLANIAGLAAICAFIPESDETNDMLALVLRGVESEVDAQFTKDGGSVEGSTAYHAFSGEMMAWTCLFTQSIPTERRERASDLRGVSLPRFARSIGWSRMRVDRAEAEICQLIAPKMKAIAFFFEDVIDTHRRIVQIGDNDSGRFLKMLPSFERLTTDDAILRYASLDGYVAPVSLSDYWDEDLLNYAGVGSVLDAVCGTSFNDYANEVEYQLTAGLLRMAMPDAPEISHKKQKRSGRHGSAEGKSEVKTFVDQDGALHIMRAINSADTQLRSYPQFGLYVYRSSDFLLHIRCGGLITLSTVGHPHDDQLAVNLSVGGQMILTDPGTFVYSAAPAARQLYRGRSAHFVPGWKPTRGERARALFDGLAHLEAGLVHSVRQDRFSGSIKIRGRTITRTINILPNEIVIRDADSDGQLVDLTKALNKLATLPPSSGYGKTLRTGSAAPVSVTALAKNSP